MSFLLNTHLQKAATLFWKDIMEPWDHINAMLHLFGAAICLDLSIIGNNLYHLSTHQKFLLPRTFKVAIEHYSKCLKGLQNRGESQSDLALKAHANRAACYKQISNFDGVIEDCTAVLEVDPENVKALVRRAQAFEGVERYRFALQDVKTVLAMPYAKVGKSNMDMCNMMQHRLNRTVQQLKSGKH